MNKQQILLLLVAAALYPALGQAQTPVERKLDSMQQELERLRGEVSKLKTEQQAPAAPISGDS